MKHIGIDFDNTIICYDNVFYQIALEQKLIPSTIFPNKTQIRDYFRSTKREDDWTRLQGYVYGSALHLAKPFPGVAQFFDTCRQQGMKISIISHKTKYPYLGPKYDLHQAAKNWLSNQPFFHSGIDTHFELTLESKLNRILTTHCDLFIDDLPELLSEPRFPSTVTKILFDPAKQHEQSKEWITMTTWEQSLSILTPYQQS